MTKIETVLFSIALLLLLLPSYAEAQGSFEGWRPDRNQWNDEEARRRIPPRWSDPYDRGPERFDRRPLPPVSPEEYERRAFCAMHPRACQ
jgi:hypothetical protein